MSPNGVPAILLVDDDPVNRKLAGLMLQRLGCTAVDVAEDGRAAVDAVLSHTYDLVLMDVEMPVLDGIEAAREIGLRLGPRRPRIVAMSGRQDDADRERCLEAGMDAYLVKPLARQRLAELLRTQAADSDGKDAVDDFNPVAWNEMLRVFKHAGVQEVVAALVADVPEQARRFAAAAAADDVAALKRIAHALRGASLQLGADALAGLCNEIETGTDSGRVMTMGASMIERHTMLVARLSREAGGA
ncbi:response regulator [Nevskia soli]|uniref:response regulator n=1 Tax=Nevskia soli TaxID=418856 RepID=UPI0004A6E915|nr:response regulator [Nevskia soli]